MNANANWTTIAQTAFAPRERAMADVLSAKHAGLGSFDPKPLVEPPM